MNQKKIRILERFVNRLPNSEKKRAIIFVDGKTFSWEELLNELKKGGKLADKLEKKIYEKLK